MYLPHLVQGERSDSRRFSSTASSQDIYLEIDGAYNAVNIQQSSYDVKYEDRDELFNLEIDFSYAIDSDRQQF